MSRSQRRPLQLYVGESDSGERLATWLELFFDLVFVVAIAQLAHFLYHELTWAGIGGFAALFVPVWWLWIDFSYYADQFDIERGSYGYTMLGVIDLLQKSLLGYYGVWKKAIAHPFFAIAKRCCEAQIATPDS